MVKRVFYLLSIIFKVLWVDLRILRIEVLRCYFCVVICYIRVLIKCFIELRKKVIYLIDFFFRENRFSFCVVYLGLWFRFVI